MPEPKTKPEETYQVGEMSIVRVLATDGYYQALEELKRLNARECSLAENAHARIQTGRKSKLSSLGNFVREEVLCVPKVGVFLTKNPIITNVASKATQAHRERKEFYPTEKQVEKALENAVQIPYKKLCEDDTISVNEFHSNEITQFAFEEHAQEYGEFLREAGIKEMTIWRPYKEDVDKQDKPFAKKLWFHNLDYGSGLDYRGNLDGCSWDLRCGLDMLLGIQN